MRKIVLYVLLVTASLSCQRVPVTGRKQLHLLPEIQLMTMSYTSYRDFLNTNKVLPPTDDRAAMVTRVGRRIEKAVTEYMSTKSAYQKRIQGFEWEYNTVDDETVNAWCMPGGKVVFYTGILPVTKDEAGLAVVMGHEIAHAIARHGNERMSQGLAIQFAGVAFAVALSQKPQLTQELFNQSYGIASTLGILAYSRKHESEADKMGLVFMAMAGYNPGVAPEFWERMAASSGGQKPPEILSTHPSDETRIKDLKAFLPTAMKYYKPQ